MSFCTKCGKKIISGARFCVGCGAAVKPMVKTVAGTEVGTMAETAVETAVVTMVKTTAGTTVETAVGTAAEENVSKKKIWTYAIIAVLAVVVLATVVYLIIPRPLSEEEKARKARGQLSTGATFTDSRNGKTYKTVKIGSQTWMAENLSYQTGSSWCYDNDNFNCEKYGRLYDWNTAMSACPTGWHLPSKDEWEDLKVAVGSFAGNKLKARSGWNDNGNGTDDYGFSALSGGNRNNKTDKFDNIGLIGFWWTTTESSSGAYNMRLGHSSEYLVGYDNLIMNGYSVRCVQNPTTSVSTNQYPSPSNQPLDSVGGSGMFIDSRDMKTYKTTVIGGTRWMAENLNIKTGTNWCYENDESNCDKYGRLYDWNTAMTACPAGWHLPSRLEWDELGYVAGSKTNTGDERTANLYTIGTTLMAKTGWRSMLDGRGVDGMDNYGFMALPGGRRYCDDSFGEVSGYGNWWSDVEEWGTHAYFRKMYHSFGGGYLNEEFTCKGAGLSVRCIKGPKASASTNPPPTPSNQQSGRGGGFGTLTDSRDGKTYKTVTIGNQTWMAQNLNYRAGRSWCYDGDNSNCEKYGRLYDWNTAREVCPANWHLPSAQEWDNLALAVGGKKNRYTGEGYDFFAWDGAGKKLKAKSGWKWNNIDDVNGNGTDDYGFSALPGGQRDSEGNFKFVGDVGYWWTATEYNGGGAYYRGMNYYSDIVVDNIYGRGFAFLVRCIKDD